MWSPVWIWESEIPNNICDQIIDCSNKIEYEKGLTQYGDDGRKVDIKFLQLANKPYPQINAFIQLNSSNKNFISTFLPSSLY